MHGEVLPPGKAFPTAEADIGFFPCVDPVVGQEAGALAEALPTVQALIGFSPRWSFWWEMRFEWSLKLLQYSEHL